jgi:hypothetical protein
MRKILRAAVFVLPVLALLPRLGDFPFTQGAAFSDLLVSHYPNTLFLQRTLLTWKTIPLWSPTILSGYPFGANPLSGLFYLPGWLALLLPLPQGINLVVILHLLWGGAGMYCLLRSEDLSERAALLGALTFEALPKLHSHLGAGHITLLYAVTWTPWLLYAERESLLRPGKWKILPGVLLGMITLADVRWAAYSGLLWVAYSLYCRIFPLSENSALRQVRDYIRTGVKTWLPVFLLKCFLAGCIAAPLLLPLVQYTRLSTRNQMTAQESFTLSMPPSQLLGLVYPNIGGAAEWMLYPGAVVLGLMLYLLCSPTARRRGGFWLAFILVTLVYSLGSYIPPLEWIARLPGMDLLRVPPRVLFVTGFCFAVVAALSLDDLIAVVQGQEQAERDRSSLVLFAITAFIVFFAAAVLIVVDKELPRFQFAWGAVSFLSGATVILLAHAKRISASILMVLMATMCLADLVGVNSLSLDFRSPQSVFSAGREAALFLREQEGSSDFRIYSPSYSLAQHTAAWYGLELADGVDPLQLAAYVRFMEAATGVPSRGYSVTLPPFANAHTATDNRDFSPDPQKLALLNVNYVLSEFPLEEDGLVLMAQFSQTHVYRNQLALPRAWVQEAGASLGEKILAEPKLERSPDQIVLHATGPGLLVLSEIAYPGWQVTIDGQAASLETVGGLLRGARLPAGEHVIRFLFRPYLVYAGLGLSALAWAILLYPWMREWVHRLAGGSRNG